MRDIERKNDTEEKSDEDREIKRESIERKRDT